MTTNDTTATSGAAVIITGGGGFLGQCLATELLKRKMVQTENQGSVPLTQLILADIFFPPTLQPIIESGLEQGLVVKIMGDISNRAYCDSLLAATTTAPHVSIFHLGAVMSGDGERDFDLCLRVNLHGCMNLLESARQHGSQTGHVPKLVLASAGATIGAGASTDYIRKSDVISDATRATPHTTYGATKACGELLASDYARRGLVHARGLRLPTIVVRAGKPNAATTSCYSSVVREPLAGVPTILPIDAHVKHAVTATRHAVSAMLTLHDAPLEQIERVLGYDRTIFLPAVALSLGDLQQALYKVVTPETQEKLGPITYEVDDHLSAVVGSFPTQIDAYRARQLGIPPAPNAETLVREYIADFPSAVASGIAIVPVVDEAIPPTIHQDTKVAVITGGGSGIGRAVAQRLAQGGNWCVVLAGRTLQTLKQTQQLLPPGTPSLVVQADVSLESNVQHLFQTVETTLGKVDLLFNNAGINSAAANLEKVDYKDFQRVLTTNVCGPFLCARAAMQLMSRGGGGRIINNGSISAHVPRPGSACYTAAKHAVLGLTKVLALDGRAHNVACGQIDFGNVVSDMSLATNQAGSGARQANGTLLEEPSMSLQDAAETFWVMANLPLEANILQMTVMATNMPFVGRG